MIQVVCGTRPEAIKLAPVVQALRRAGLPTTLIGTTQQGPLVERAFAEVGLAVDRWVTAPQGAGLAGAVSGLLAALQPVLDGRCVVVHGDTSTALAGALAGFYAQIPVAHVEAGLRSFDPSQPYPEEMHRQLIDRLATWWFAPTEGAGEQLRREGCAPGRVHVVGNTVVDAMQAALGRSRPWRSWGLDDGLVAALEGPARVVLATCHRRENHGAPMRRVIEALEALAADHEVLWMQHPNPFVPLEVRGARGVTPQSHALFVQLLARADVVLTDSGGVQEEAVALGRRALVLREVTERPEGLEAGLLTLVGTDTGRIVDAARAERRGPLRPAGVYGDGQAGERIAAVLASSVSAP